MTFPIRVLHLIEDLGSGGAERLLFTNLSRLNRKKFDGIVCHLYDRNHHWNQAIRNLSYPVICLQLNSVYDLGRGLFRLLKLLNRDPVDLIHTHLYGANLLGHLAGRVRRIPVLSSIHCPDYEPLMLLDNPALSRTKLGILRLVDQFSCRLADPEFLAVSTYIKQYAVQYLGISPNRICVIYNPIDVNAFAQPAGDTAHLRSELGIAPHAPVVLCVARLCPQKGVRYLLEAVPMVSGRVPNVCILFVGAAPPETRRAYLDRAKELGVASRIRFLGIQADVRPYLQLCDVFVLPSLAEGFGMAVVEAMAMERACVATRVSALPEVVEDGQSGILVEPADPAALAEAIIRLLDDPPLRARMGAQGRKLVTERFNAERNVPELESLYLRILGKGPNVSQ